MGNSLGLFVLFNSKREKILCSWFDNISQHFGQKVYYIGQTNGLGGLEAMKSLGWFLRSSFKDNGIENFYSKKDKLRLNLWVKQEKVAVYESKGDIVYIPNVKVN